MVVTWASPPPGWPRVRCWSPCSGCGWAGSRAGSRSSSPTTACCSCSASRSSRSGPATLAVLAGVWLVLAPLVSHWLRPELPPRRFDNASFDQLGEPVLLASELLVTGYYPVLTWLAYLFAGMAVGRSDLGRRTVQAGLLAGGLVLAAGSALLSELLTEGRFSEQALDRVRTESYGTTPTGSRIEWLLVSAPHSGTPFDLAQTTGSALAVIGLCLLVLGLLPPLPGSRRRRGLRRRHDDAHPVLAPRVDADRGPAAARGARRDDHPRGRPRRHRRTLRARGGSGARSRCSSASPAAPSAARGESPLLHVESPRARVESPPASPGLATRRARLATRRAGLATRLVADAAAQRLGLAAALLGLDPAPAGGLRRLGGHPRSGVAGRGPPGSRPPAGRGRRPGCGAGSGARRRRPGSCRPGPARPG